MLPRLPITSASVITDVSSIVSCLRHFVLKTVLSKIHHQPSTYGSVSVVADAKGLGARPSLHIGGYRILVRGAQWSFDPRGGL